ncbi:MAG: glycoside hydrolase family 99-like domain-containing protein [Methanobacterium sp.]
MDVFTSITINYLPKARVLANSLKKFHPEWKLHLVICDAIADSKNTKVELDANLFDRVVWLEDLDIPDLQAWIYKHSVVELCTAIKGYYLQRLAKEGAEKIIYIDPDIVVFNNLGPLERLLDENAILLIPHLLDYTNDPRSIRDNEIMGTLRHGTFNFGFLGVNPTRKEGIRFTEWWSRRLLDHCYADYENGLFTDQKWGDLIPSFFEDYHIVRDPGYDVASWNLDCRQISIDKKGQILINENYPLRFYHFTGYDSGAGLSVIRQLTEKGSNDIVNELWGWYNHQLLVNGQIELGKKKCIYDYYDDGKEICKEERITYRSRPDLQIRFKNPYNTKRRFENYRAWWESEYPELAAKNTKTDGKRKHSEHSENGLLTSLTDAKSVAADIYSQLVDNEKIGQSEEYVPLSSEAVSGANAPVRLISFYLPQFHPIPENDTWWGKGFTEWNNVTRAIPQFPGHYQPHLPGELGFYDLRLEEVQYRQIELAKQYGIYGFAFYYYWFAGRRILEFPINRFLNNKGMDFPFCLIWANENWTKRWDGLEKDILLQQDHTPETDAAFIKDLDPFLRDERYIRINDRPVIIVYRANIMPNAINTANIWREYCLKNHLGNPYLIAAQTFGFYEPQFIGFDAAVQFPPHNQLYHPRFNITSQIKKANPDNKSLIFSYPEVVKFKENDREDVPYRLFKTVFPNWDNEPRKPGRSTIFAGSTPELYKRWLRNECRWTIENNPAEERFVFINAWNEWAEGAHLEPDRRFGYAYLQATMDVMRSL